MNAVAFFLLYMFGLGFQEIIVIVLIILILFGGKKIPEMMKGIGKGIRSFKEGMNGVDDDVKDSKEEKKSDEQK